MSSFQINSTDPPENGLPRGRGYNLILPEPSGTDGEDRPCGAVGLPRIEIRFKSCSQTVWNWYTAFTEDDPYVALTSVRGWNDYKTGGAGWTTWSGAGIIMHRPTYEEMAYGRYFGVRVVISNLQ